MDTRLLKKLKKRYAWKWHTGDPALWRIYPGYWLIADRKKKCVYAIGERDYHSLDIGHRSVNSLFEYIVFKLMGYGQMVRYANRRMRRKNLHNYKNFKQ